MLYGNGRNYFLWLVDKVNDEFIEVDEYSLLLEYLFNRDFTWSIAMDSNRASDGLNLRYEYGYETEDRPCSVLEMLIALAINWEHEITYDFHKGDRSSIWFWTMLNNLELLEYPNWLFEEDEVSEIIDVWLDRKYHMDGSGGLFPVKNSRKDQRKMEIWLQLQEFVLENVEI